MKHLRDSDIRTSNGRGTLLFNNDFEIFDATCRCTRPATAVENFLLGHPSRLSVSVGNQYRGYHNWEHTFYLHDRFQARDDLLLNWGLRYEVLTVPHEVNHLFEFIHDTDANNFAPQFGFAWNSGRAGIVVRGGYGIAFGSLTLTTTRISQRGAAGTSDTAPSARMEPTTGTWPWREVFCFREQAPKSSFNFAPNSSIFSTTRSSARQALRFLLPPSAR